MRTDHTADETLGTAARNKQTVRRLYEAYINGARRELLPELVGADYAGPQGERGPDGFAAAIGALRGALPDIRFTLEELVAEGDRVAVRWTWTGTHTGPLRGIPASHRRVTDAGIAIYTLRDGRVVSAALQTDRLGVLQQIGALPADLVPGAAPGGAA